MFSYCDPTLLTFNLIALQSSFEVLALTAPKAGSDKLLSSEVGSRMLWMLAGQLLNLRNMPHEDHHVCNNVPRLDLIVDFMHLHTGQERDAGFGIDLHVVKASVLARELCKPILNASFPEASSKPRILQGPNPVSGHLHLQFANCPDS